MDRSLDEILADRESQPSGRSRGRGGGQRRREPRQENYPRDGVRKVRKIPNSLAAFQRFSVSAQDNNRREPLRCNSPSPEHAPASLRFLHAIAALDALRAMPPGLLRPRKVINEPNHEANLFPISTEQSYRDEEPRNLNTEWVHDRYNDDNGSRRQRDTYGGRGSSDPAGAYNGAKVKVDNVHYELTKEDLEGLFNKIGPVVKLDIRYDRAGRSMGTAFVTYESRSHAQNAVKEFDGANANGQPIRLSVVAGPRARNPFDTAIMPGRPLSERVTLPPGRSRSLSPDRRYNDDDASRRGIDRYVPGHGSRSRSPLPPRRREGGRRPGARRGDGRGRGRDTGARDDGDRKGRDGRPRKTQEELDAEMEDYFGGAETAETQTSTAATNGTAATQALEDDIDMIE